MAQLVYTAVGAVLDAYTGGTGFFTATFSAIGASVEQSKQKFYGPRLEDLKFTATDYGAPISYLIGAPRVSSGIWWASDKHEVATSERQGKGSGPTVTTYSYEIDLICGLSENEIAGVTRIWWNGKLVWSARSGSSARSRMTSEITGYWRRMTVYHGTEDQLPDPTYEAAVGAGNAPAYRGRAYVFFEGLNLGTSGMLPNLTFEVATRMQPEEIERVGFNPDTGFQFGRITGTTTFGVPAAVGLSPDGLRVTEIQANDGLGNNPVGGLVYRFDLDGVHTGAEPLGYGELYPTMPGGTPVVSIPVGNIAVVGGVRVQNVDQPFGGGQIVMVPRLTPMPDGELLTGTDLTDVCPPGRYIGGVVLCSDRIHALILSAPSNALTGASIVDRWDLVRFGEGEIVPTLERSGTFETPVSMETFHFGNNGSGHVLTGYAVASMMDDDLTTVWKAAGSSQVVQRWEIGADDVMRKTHDFTTQMRPIGDTNWGLPTVWAQHGYFAVICANTYSLFGPGGSDPEYPTLQETVEELCERAEMPAGSYDATALASVTRPVRAMSIGRVGPTRHVVEQLQAAFFFEATLSDKLYFRPRAAEPVATIPFADLATGLEQAEAEPLALTLASDLELASQVAVKFHNMADDQQTGTEYSDRLMSGQASVQTIELAVGLLPSEGKAVADAIIADSLASLTTAPISIPLPYARLEAGDVVTVIDEDGVSAYRLRLVRKSDESVVHRFEAVVDDAAVVVSAGVTDGDYDPETEVTEPSATLMLPLDIPLLRDADDGAGYYVAARGVTPTWPGAAVMQSVNGTDYAQVAEIYEKAVMGVTIGSLGDWAGGHVFDEINTLDVQVGEGELSSATRDTLIRDTTTNALLVGDEIIRFVTAELLSTAPNTYRLSRLLRGQRGTEWASVDHTDGEPVVLLRPQGMRHIPQAGADIGALRYLKGVTFGKTLASAATMLFTNTGVSSRPIAPVDVRGARDPATGEIAITWQRRTRLQASFTGPTGTNVPLGEATEAYEVDIFSDPSFTTLLRTLATDEPSAAYTVAEQQEDFAGDLPEEIYVRVHQMSAIVGRGYGAERALLGLTVGKIVSVAFDEEATFVYSGIDTRGDGAILYKQLLPPGVGAPNSVLLPDAGGAVLEMSTSGTLWKLVSSASATALGLVPPTPGSSFGQVACFLAGADVLQRAEWTGNGSGARDIAHTLDTAPVLALVKSATLGDLWWMYSAEAGAGVSLRFPDVAPNTFDADPDAFPSLSTGAALKVGADLNASGQQYLALLFAGDGAQVATGTYTGNGTASGPTVNLGWEPDVLIVRGIDGTAARTFITCAALDDTDATHWFLDDQGTSPEVSAIVDRTSTGFQPIADHASVNESGTTYQFWARKRG